MPAEMPNRRATAARGKLGSVRTSRTKAGCRSPTPARAGRSPDGRRTPRLSAWKSAPIGSADHQAVHSSSSVSARGVHACPKIQPEASQIRRSTIASADSGSAAAPTSRLTVCKRRSSSSMLAALAPGALERVRDADRREQHDRAGADRVAEGHERARAEPHRERARHRRRDDRGESGTTCPRA